MSTEVACDFTSTGRVPHMDRVFQVKLLGELREIVRVGVHVVAVPGLRGTAVASPSLVVIVAIENSPFVLFRNAEVSPLPSATSGTARTAAVATTPAPPLHN